LIKQGKLKVTKMLLPYQQEVLAYKMKQAKLRRKQRRDMKRIMLVKKKEQKLAKVE
jgi:hypothetical protein